VDDAEEERAYCEFINSIKVVVVGLWGWCRQILALDISDSWGQRGPLLDMRYGNGALNT
jgi:hypothetical protein